MVVTVELNTAPTVDSLNALRSRHLPFATSVALNRTALAARAVQVDRMLRTFRVRRRQRVSTSIAMKASTKAKLEVTLTVRDPFLAVHERGGLRRPGDVTKALVRPVARAQQRVGVIRGRNTPRGAIDQEPQRTWVGRTKSGKAVVFRRSVGKGRRLQVLFALERSVSTAPRLEFVKTVTTVARAHWPVQFASALRAAIR